MTALKEYARLESGGLWRADADAQRRDVIVSFGDATLVISDSAERALAHWSLPAIERLNVGERPAIFSPDPEATETLEIEDDTMIAAIEKVRKTVEKQRPKPKRLRYLGLGLSVAAVAALAVFWLPDALIRQTVSVVPAVKRSEIGGTLLGHIQRVTGPTCRSQLGTQALDQLRARALGRDAGGQIVVVPGGVQQALYLPGGIIVMNRALVEDTEDPATVAGHAIAAAAGLRVQDPLATLLKEVGVRATFQLLTTGDLDSETLRAYAEVLIASPPQRPPDDALIPLFEAAQIPSTPFAFAVDKTGETTLGLIEADPMQGREAPAILNDGEWISLQGICS